MPAFLESELPVQAEVRHHWITMLRKPSLLFGIVLIALFVLAVVYPWPMILILLAIVVLTGFLRWQTWDAERIILTQMRIVRVRGVPETTKTEASLRLDRISGAVIEQTVMGKLFDYATIELEASGDHPDVRHLINIERPHQFYDVLRKVIFGADEHQSATRDPEELGGRRGHVVEDEHPTRRYPDF